MIDIGILVAIIIFILGGLASMSWYFYRRSIRQADEKVSLSDKRVALVDGRVSDVRDMVLLEVSRIVASLNGMRSDIKDDIQQSRNDLTQQIANLRVELAKDYILKEDHYRDLDRLENITRK